MDGLFSLTNQSLLRAIEDPDRPGFEMLETIREFATEMLEGRGQREELERRHGAWFAAFAKRASVELSGDEQRVWLERFEHAHDNIRVALDRAVAREDVETAISLAFSTWRFWQKRGHLYEARRRLEVLAAAAWSKRDPVLRARLLEALGGVCWWQGDVARMGLLYREAAEIWRSLDDRGELANALYNYSFTFTVPPDTVVGSAIDTDPTGEGLGVLKEALAIYRELGDERGEANVLWGLGNREYFANAIDPGSDHLRLALEKFRKVGDRTMEGWSLHMLGSALIRLGRLDEARPDLMAAVRLFHEASDAAGLTLVLDDLSSLALAEGKLDRAGRLWGAARNLVQTTGAALASLIDDSVELENRPNVRKSIAPKDLERLGREGAAMTLDEIVAYALNEHLAARTGSAD
jgi:non-specific serine/threonine protein kinase